MVKNLGADIINQIATGAYKYHYLVKVSIIGTGDADLTTAPRSISYAGDTYFSAATLGIQGITEALRLETNEVIISLSGITDTYKALIQKVNFIGSNAKMWTVFFSDTDETILNDPVLLWEGKILESAFSYDFGSKTASISLTVGDYFSRFDTAKGARSNPTEWKQIYPGDKIFDQIPQIANKEIVF